MSEHIAAAIADFEQQIVKLTDIVAQLRWFQREFPHTADTMKRTGPPRAKPKRAAMKATNGKAARPNSGPRTAPAEAAVQKRTGTNGHTSRAGMASPARTEVVQARDGAIVARLKKGAATTSVLKDAMPKESGMTDDQRTSACANALTRLKLKNLIKQADDGGWTLA